MALTKLSSVVDELSAGRIDLLVRQMADRSRAQVRGMVDQGCVWINGNRCHSVGTVVVPGDQVTVSFDPHQRYREKKKQWDDRVFRLVFEDDHLIVVDKSAGSLTVPTDHHEPNTLVQRVSVYLSHSRRKRVAHVVHRLD